LNTDNPLITEDENWGKGEKLITGESFLEHSSTGGVIQTCVSLGIDASEQHR